ncbi:acyl-CoA dehydrogenase family protein [uncultured Umboniibacter sp.]|uniref:acyl-CoA dehydrogenase family protein n=1 Tax=uncultured Umboniibacter sp. TaxID=1798917 RepID=UPI0026082CC9|nr:acyl-CoA dehydrogenase family protein [uncultured Umboniibacter sp.]
MDFSLSDDQRAFMELANNFANDELAPFAAEWDRDSHFPVETIRKAAALGFCGLYAPEDIGGLALSRLDSHLIFEQLSKGCTATTAYLTIHNMAAWMLGTWGTDLVKTTYGEAMTQGELLGSYCLTEPGAGSDAASLRTKAEKVAGGYQLSGAKVFISGAGSTDVLIVMARTGDKGAGGVSAFVVPARSEGISYGKKEEKMGWNCQPTRMITFDQVFVPADHLLGNEGDGFKFAMKGLDGGRINIATCSLGTAQAALEISQQYLQEREQFGKPIAANQALQFRLADMATELLAARQLVRYAAAKLDAGDANAAMHCAMAKRFATDVGFEVCNQALQLHGGYGYIKEYPLERMVRDTRVHQILEGTNEVMRVIVSRRLFMDQVCEGLQL